MNQTATSDVKFSLFSPAGTHVLLAPSYSEVLDELEMKLWDGYNLSDTIPLLPISPVAGTLQHSANVKFIATETNCCYRSFCSYNVDEYDPSAVYGLLLQPNDGCTYAEQMRVIYNTPIAMSPHPPKPRFVIIERSSDTSMEQSHFPVFSVSKSGYERFHYHSYLDHTLTIAVSRKYKKMNANFQNWMFSTTHFWKEHAKGMWRFVAQDEFEGDEGTIDNFQLTLHTLRSLA